MKNQSLTIKHLPKMERPRERLSRLGPEALGTAELLAIILRTGISGANALVIADKLLVRFTNLKELAGAAVEELAAIDGIGQSKAVRLKAAFELGRRVGAFVDSERPIIRGPQDVAALVIEKLRLLKQEVFKVLILNTKNVLLKIEKVTVGTLNASLIHPRELFRPAIRLGANSIILVHNHPSGDPAPSPEDIQVTRKLVSAGEIVGIEIQDHVIVGDSSYISLKEKGYF